MVLTAKEIADMIGVSPATLSLVVNNKPGISDRTRQKVINELKKRKFNYLLNELTEKDNNNRKVIGFVNYRVGGELLGEDSFFPMILDGIENRARKHGYNLTYINISRENARNEIKSIVAAECQGIVLFATEMKKEDMEPFLNLGIPFIILDNHFNSLPINSVKVNNEQGTYIAVEYLYKHGHRKIGYLQSGIDINSFQERYDCARKALEKFSLEIPDKYVWVLGYPMKAAYTEMKRFLLKKSELPSAFLADNDLVAAGAMKAVREAGLRVPEDVSFVGFDNRPICFLTEPGLSTVQLPSQYFGAEAIEMLVRTLEGEDDMQMKLEISTTMVERGSVAEIK